MSNFCNVILKQKDGYFWISIFSYFFLELDYTTHWMFSAHYEPTHMSLFVSVFWLLCWHCGLLVSCFSFVVKFEDSLWMSSFIVSRCYIYWVPLYFLGLGCVPWHLVGVLSSSSCLFSIVCLLCFLYFQCLVLLYLYYNVLSAFGSNPSLYPSTLSYH